MRIIKHIYILIFCILSINCSVSKKIANADGAVIVKELKSTKEMLDEPERSRLSITLLDQEDSLPLKTYIKLLVNNIQFLPDSGQKFNLNFFSGRYFFQAIGLGYDKKNFKLFVDEKYNYKISVKLNPNKTTYN